MLVPEGLYLWAVIKLLYRFICDQGYRVVDSEFVRRERAHQDILGYDDILVSGRYRKYCSKRQGLSNFITFFTRGYLIFVQTRLVDLPSAERFIELD